MNGTPRLRSAFPATPPTGRTERGQHRASPDGVRKRTSLQPIPEPDSSSDVSPPTIPLDLLDAAQQRLIVAAVYTALWTWRLYDAYTLDVNEEESLWQFLKWAGVDIMFFYGLSALGVPWLDWSSATTTLVWVLHAALDAMLMFRIGVPLTSWLMALGKLFYDRELAILEQNVKPADVQYNPHLILGKQVVHILPEGTAMLNPEKRSFCLSPTSPQIQLPIYINQTEPVLIDLERIDLETSQVENITVSKSSTKSLSREAHRRAKATGDPNGPLVLQYPVKKTGVYRLKRIVDDANLDIQARSIDTSVVTCPSAQIRPTAPNKCRNDLLDMALEVRGTPPLKVKYRYIINTSEREAVLHSLQPDDFISPLTHQPSNMLVSGRSSDVSWARPQTVVVPLSQTLEPAGRWQYSIEAVEDALGNRVSYFEPTEDGGKAKSEKADVERGFIVHERPIATLRNCDSQHPLLSPKGQFAQLPVHFTSTGKEPINDISYTVAYRFTPEDELTPTKEHGISSEVRNASLKDAGYLPFIMEPGLYSLSAVATQYCSGDVYEPASCLLQNPPQPDLSITSENIVDKCAERAVGLSVVLDLTGTPPFTVQYTTQRRGDRGISIKSADFSNLRGQVDLQPSEEGHYTYTFTEMSDAVYKSQSLKDKNLILEQDVKPRAFARFKESRPEKMACIDTAVSFDVMLQGEGPWTLEYELTHGGKKTRRTVEDILEHSYHVQTPTLDHGGEHTLSLVSVKDANGCKEFLKEDAKIQVRHQRPKASFGLLEGKRRVQTLEHKTLKLPVRLTGEAPWTVTYHNINKPNSAPQRKQFAKPNDFLEIREAGLYEIQDVKDAHCPGVVDQEANHFEVAWIPRPSIRTPDGGSVKRVDGKYVKSEVCETDIDRLELLLTGTAPFEIKYEEHRKPDQGPKGLKQHSLNAALTAASVQLDTLQAGLYEYKFTELSDNNYDHDAKTHTPVVVTQRVNPRPNVRFARPGESYSYCHDGDSEGKSIPITLTGIPPFHLSIEIKHQGNSKPETLDIPNISSNTYDLHIPPEYRHLGVSHIYLTKVLDARGCASQLSTSSSPPPRVQITVYDPPQISSIDSREDFCVGERLAFTILGLAPYNVYYTFEGQARKASSSTTTFRRIAEKPGVFTITGVSDSASMCTAPLSIHKTIHPLPSVQISKGKETRVDIHEGGEAELLFEFTGTPPFEFRYTRRENLGKRGAGKILETRFERSDGNMFRTTASEEGVYEVVSVRDRWCHVEKPGAEMAAKGGKLLTY